MIKKSIALFLSAIVLLAPITASALSEAELKAQIDTKSQELQAVSQKIVDTQGSLNETTAKGKTLKQEVDKIDKSIQTVVLGIKQSEILVEKYGLEIESLGNNIEDSEKALADKKEAISGIFQSLQERDNESALLTFLNAKSLTGSFLEFQTLSDLNGELVTQMDDIRDLKNELQDKQGQVLAKKSATETERMNLRAKQSIAEDQKAERASLLAKTKNQEKLYQLQLDELEKKQQAISDEIDAIESSLRSNYNPSQVPGKRPGVFANPVAEVRITQQYGATQFARSNGKYYPKGTHNGMDFGAPLGTPIFAAADGTVTLSSKNGTSAERFYYGKFVLLKHANNLSTIYGHMSRQAVTTGQVVKKGDIIGYVGKTGYATGYHVHFGVFITDSIKMNNISGAGILPAGYTLNPADYL